MPSPIEIIKELPLDVRRNAVWEILETFPSDDPMFENRLDDTLSDREILIIEERHRKIERGEMVWHSREEVESLVKLKTGY
jgi:hypothetical protein